MISWFDFLYLTFLVAILPVWGKYDYQNFLKNAAVTENDVLSAEYRRNILILFLMTAVIYLIWKFTGRSWSGLGFNLPNWNGAEWSGLLISGGLIVGTSINVFIALFIPEAAQKRLESYAELKPFFPHTATQHRWGMLVSCAAGISEEIVYRGFVIWILQQHMPIYLALIIQAIIFGLAHLYQGKVGMLTTALVGGILGYVYWATGSLLLPILLHCVMDMASMTAAYITLSRPDNNN